MEGWLGTICVNHQKAKLSRVSQQNRPVSKVGSEGLW
jgi:hypothetical protein